MIKILVVEDEKPISDLIRMNLEDQGFDITCAYDGMQAADLLEEHDYDLVLLDIMLPKVDGYELLEYIKPLEIPVIFLTAKAGLNDRVKGLNLGAEDYIVKPFEIVELLARVNVVLRRFGKTDTVLTYKDIEIDTKAQKATKNGVDPGLTKKEYELLLMLVRNVGITLFRERIYDEIWGEEPHGASRTLDLHIQRLRKKLDLTDDIVSVYKTGYRLEKDK
ncbi:MAG: response regulator transcription factor [Lachnospiraceae bacterium]|nr:response regulator transcription factor [Lachnospiraceae bacterium]